MPSDVPTASNALIGVFDSGVGGLSILREIHRALPFHPTLYYADQAHLPYGTKSKNQLLDYVSAIVRYMIADGAQVIVLACNTASAACLHDLRAAHPEMPFVGMEPAIKPAVEASRTGIVGVLATQVTADGDLYRATLAKFAGEARVITQVAPALVTLVESGEWASSEARQLIAEIIAPILHAGADQVALACTHFPFLIEALQAVAGEGVTFIDPSPAVARQTRRVLIERGLLVETGTARATHRYFSSAAPERLRAMITRLIGVDADVQHLIV